MHLPTSLFFQVFGVTFGGNARLRALLPIFGPPLGQVYIPGIRPFVPVCHNHSSCYWRGVWSQLEIKTCFKWIFVSFVCVQDCFRTELKSGLPFPHKVWNTRPEFYQVTQGIKNLHFALSNGSVVLLKPFNPQVAGRN